MPYSYQAAGLGRGANPYFLQQSSQISAVRPATQGYPSFPVAAAGAPYSYPSYSVGSMVGIKPASEAYPVMPAHYVTHQPSFVPRGPPAAPQQGFGGQPRFMGKGRAKGGWQSGPQAKVNAANALPLGKERTWNSTPENSSEGDPKKPSSPVHRPVQVIGRGRALTLPAWAQKSEAPPGRKESTDHHRENPHEGRRDNGAHRTARDPTPVRSTPSRPETVVTEKSQPSAGVSHRSADVSYRSREKSYRTDERPSRRESRSRSRDRYRRRDSSPRRHDRLDDDRRHGESRSTRRRSRSRDYSRRRERY